MEYIYAGSLGRRHSLLSYEYNNTFHVYIQEKQDKNSIGLCVNVRIYSVARANILVISTIISHYILYSIHICPVRT